MPNPISVTAATFAPPGAPPSPDLLRRVSSSFSDDLLDLELYSKRRGLKTRIKGKIAALLPKRKAGQPL